MLLDDKYCKYRIFVVNLPFGPYIHYTYIGRGGANIPNKMVSKHGLRADKM